MDSPISCILQYWQSATSTAPISALVVLLLLCPIIFLYFKSTKSMGKAPPEASGAWPMIGHLHKLLGANDLLHRVLGSMADKYGPAFSIRYGMHQTLVVSNWEMVKECCTTTNDKLFSNRPIPLVNKLLFYSDYSFGFGPYGQFWKDMRKISVLHLLSNQRIGQLRSSIVSEMNASFKDLYQMCVDNRAKGIISEERPVLVEMKTWLNDVMLNVAATVVIGKRNMEGERKYQYKKVIDEARGHLATFAVTDVIPFLWWIDYLRGVNRSMKQTGKKIDDIIRTWLEEHRHRRYQKKLLDPTGASSDVDDHQEEDFMDAMLSIAEDDIEVFAGHDVDTVIKCIIADMILGGSDSVATMLIWTLSLLLNNRHILEKVREELDLIVGNERRVEESDLKDLVYLQAIFKESMRLFPAAPLNLRYTTEDCNVGGFHIGAGTRLLINIWKVQRDPSVWPDPLEFRPERFLNNMECCNINVRGKDFELIPFGCGRRMCPGISFSLELMSLVLARLIHGYNLMTPAEDPIVDMSETPGFFNYKATPLNVLLSPRIKSEKVYNC